MTSFKNEILLDSISETIEKTLIDSPMSIYPYGKEVTIRDIGDDDIFVFDSVTADIHFDYFNAREEAKLVVKSAKAELTKNFEKWLKEHEREHVAYQIILDDIYIVPYELIKRDDPEYFRFKLRLFYI